MKKKDVPQDGDLTSGLKEICYAVGEDGRYELVPSLGWDPKITTLMQAWEVIDEQIEDVIRQIEAGKSSPLAYFMMKNQMDAGLLAKYVRLPRWQVAKHLKPDGFRNLTPNLLKRYSELFEIPIDHLTDASVINVYEAKRKEKPYGN